MICFDIGSLYPRRPLTSVALSSRPAPAAVAVAAAPGVPPPRRPRASAAPRVASAGASGNSDIGRIGQSPLLKRLEGNDGVFDSTRKLNWFDMFDLWRTSKNANAQAAWQVTIRYKNLRAKDFTGLEFESFSPAACLQRPHAQRYESRATSLARVGPALLAWWRHMAAPAEFHEDFFQQVFIAEGPRCHVLHGRTSILVGRPTLPSAPKGTDKDTQDNAP